MSETTTTNICLYIEAARVHRWHSWLMEELRVKGHEVVFCPAACVSQAMAPRDLMLRLERMIYRLSGDQAFDLLRDSEVMQLPVATAGSPRNYDILIDFTVDGEGAPSADRRLTPRFDGEKGELGAFKALLDQRNVELTIEDTALDGQVWNGRPTVEEKHVIGRALNNVFSRAAELLLQAVDGKGSTGAMQSADGTGLSAQSQSSRVAMTANSVAHLTRKLGGKVGRRLTNRMSPAERWAIGWRRLDGPGLLDSDAPAEASYHLIPDDGERYFADPFIFQRDGISYIFCEEYPYDSKKGVISYFELDAAGNLSPPHRALERPYHLSYPHLIEAHGEIWMIPEAGAGGSVELYRAARFPDEWVLERVLLPDVAGFDATVWAHDGKLWMFLSTASRLSSSWDNLNLYVADDLFGDWRPHDMNPVLVDGYLSRPGGEVVEKDGVWLRPAQDGGEMYGGGLNICRIDRLDEHDYEQTVIGTIAATAPDGAYGMHTINRVGDLEVVDILGKIPIDAPTASVRYEPVEEECPTAQRQSTGRVG